MKQTDNLKQTDDLRQTNDLGPEQLIKMLDSFAASGESRLKIEISDEIAEGESKRQYHHGRCDIGSPWAKGCAFDVLEDEP